MTSVLHNHQEWLMALFALRKFRIIDLDVKNKRVTFPQRDICVLCESTPISSWKIITDERNNRPKKNHQLCKVLKSSACHCDFSLTKSFETFLIILFY